MACVFAGQGTQLHPLALSAHLQHLNYKRAIRTTAVSRQRQGESFSPLKVCMNPRMLLALASTPQKANSPSLRA